MKKKKCLLVIIFVAIIACGSSGTDKTTKPVILISHPSRIFLSGYLNLVDKKMLPESKLVLLFHAKQQKRIGKIKQYLNRQDFFEYKVVILHGYPKIKISSRLLGKFKYNTIEDYDLFFKQSRKPYLPGSWQKKFKRLVDTTDAYFIPGGSNVPARYHRQKQFVEAISSTPLRTLYEYAFLRFLLNSKQAYLKNKPNYLLVGFCYGHQLLNVAMEGDLFQSIPIEVYGQKYIRDIINSHPDQIHRNFFLAKHPPLTRTYNGWFHRIKIINTSDFIYNNPGIYILSNHQQAIKRLGKNLVVTATSVDGRIIEAVRHNRYKNVIGIQGHPERQFALDQLHKFSKHTRKFHKQFWKTINSEIISNMKKRNKTM